MIQEIIKQWEEKKHKLESYFRTTKQSEYCNSYKQILEKIFELVIDGYSADKITEIDNGDYQGTLIFLIPFDTYQPDFEDYLITNTYYGSCSGCDTLQGISSYDSNIPNEEQIKDYMMLSLHLIQRLQKLQSIPTT